MNNYESKHWDPDSVSPNGVKYVGGRWQKWEDGLIRRGVSFDEVVAMTGRRPDEVRLRFERYGVCAACATSLI